MIKKAYFEITNVCNLSCSFCHGTKRPPRFVSPHEFRTVAEKLKGKVTYLFFHLMGEPLLHPLLGEFLAISKEYGFKVILTTNGTLLRDRKDEILSSPALHKISISLHSFEANDVNFTLDEYVCSVLEFCREAAAADKIAVMRLWNKGGKESLNEDILTKLREYFPGEWKESYSSLKLAERIYLEWGQKFDWPDMSAEEMGCNFTCYGMRDQIGILSDGTVVPCCLDSEGDIALGNIFTDDLDDIVSSPRAVAIKEGFENRNVTEPLCRRCGFAAIKKF
ncbi:MAG: radical SAM protein [Clostridia bacterium]|nr:radical SAM protein [Clostridia bacterium]